MYHHRVMSLHHRPLARDAVEARRLWEYFEAEFPEAIAMCIMPDHGHILLPHADPTGRIAQVESQYARWRNHHRGESGPVFTPAPPVEHVPQKRHAAMIRYVLLNPCRAGLVDDPLSWPWSTHRDRVGLVARPLGPVEAQPARFHARISSDTTVRIGGTPFPVATHRKVVWNDVVAAVSCVTRSLSGDILRRGPPRILAVQLAWIHGFRDLAVLGRFTGLRRSRLFAIAAETPEAGGEVGALAARAAVIGDKRFACIR